MIAQDDDYLYPFDPSMEGGYFQVANVVVDKLLTLLKGASLSVMLVLIRNTRGWQKDWDRISISQFMQKTGYGNQAIVHALKKLEEKGLIVSQSSPKGNLYRLNPAYRVPKHEAPDLEGLELENAPDLEEMELEDSPDESGVKITQVGVKSSVKITHTKDNVNKNKTSSRKGARNGGSSHSLPADFPSSENEPEYVPIDDPETGPPASTHRENSNKDFSDVIHAYPRDIQAILILLRQHSGLEPPNGKKDKAFWISGARALLEACGENDPAEIFEALFSDREEAQRKGKELYLITSPRSLVNMARGKCAQLNQGQSRFKPRRSGLGFN